MGENLPAHGGLEVSEWRAHPKGARPDRGHRHGIEDGSADLNPFVWHTAGADILTKVGRGEQPFT